MLVRAILAATLALVTALPAAAQQAGDEAERRRLPGIVGVVVDRETRRPLDGAAVLLEPAGEAWEVSPGPERVLTDEEGNFALAGLAPGRWELRVESLGYRAVVDSVEYRSELGLRVEVALVPDAVELEPLLVVTEARSRNLEASGFYDRRRRGIGRFVSREEMEARLLPRVSDLFRTMPGVRMSTPRRFGEEGVVLLRGGCEADVWLDGVRTSSPFPVDALVGPHDLDGVEVYHGSEVPARFGPSTCGAVLIWTHVPNRGSGRPWSWGKFLTALGVLGTTIILLR